MCHPAVQSFGGYCEHRKGKIIQPIYISFFPFISRRVGSPLPLVKKRKEKRNLHRDSRKSKGEYLEDSGGI